MELISIEMPGVVVHSVYKPPNKFVLSAVRHGNLPHIVIGAFISPITMEKRLHSGQIRATSH